MSLRPIRVAVLRFYWAGGPIPPDALPHPTWPDDFYFQLFQASNGWSIRDYWLRTTFGLLQLEFDLSIAPWWHLREEGQSHASLSGSRGGVITACRREVEANGISLAEFDHVVAFMHAPQCNAGAAGVGQDAAFDQNGTLDFYLHEIGHVLGFEHAFGPFIPPPLTEYGSVYNDPYCVMGYSGRQGAFPGWPGHQDHSIAQPPQFAQTQILQGADFWNSERRPSAASLYRRFMNSEDFVNSGWVQHVVPGERVWIAALSEPANTTPVMAVMPLDGDPSKLLTIEYRTAVSDDAGVTPGVVVHSIGVHDVGEGRSEVDPPWFEGTFQPIIGASLKVLGNILVVKTLFTGSPAGVEIQISPVQTVSQTSAADARPFIGAKGSIPRRNN